MIDHVLARLAGSAEILLNLVFSAAAFFTGALVGIAQEAQTRTDKADEVAAARSSPSARPTCCRRTPISPSRSTT